VGAIVGEPLGTVGGLVGDSVEEGHRVGIGVGLNTFAPSVVTAPNVAPAPARFRPPSSPAAGHSKPFRTSVWESRASGEAKATSYLNVGAGVGESVGECVGESVGIRVGGSVG
jgi:hypothetical protein